MREIKFRAWDGKEMHHQDNQYLTSFLRRFISSVNHEKELITEHESYLPKQLDEYLLQYTGLKDKNGVEIYEGDIINRKYHHGVLSWEAEFIGEVKFLEGAWLIDSGSDAMYLWSETEENEVIGNIYENPELLEV